jgi:hypothetical protein
MNQPSKGRAAEVVRDLLASRLGGPDRVPQDLIDAVALGKGDREEVRRKTLGVCGTEQPFDLVRFDTDRIREYVYESSRPPVIAGASRILLSLNEDIQTTYPRWTLFSGGGEGLLLAPGGKGPAIREEIERRYKDATAGALSVTTEHLPVGPHDLIATQPVAEPSAGVRLVTGTQAVLARLHDRIRRKKDETLPLGHDLPGLATRCISCRDRAGTLPLPVKRSNPEEQRGPLCEPCLRRWSKGRDIINGISFDELVENLPWYGTKARYLGFLYADGNSMGALFGWLRHLEDLCFLSAAVTHIFERAKERAQDTANHLLRGVAPEDRPFLSYLGGGDEAIWIAPAAIALELADQLPRWIEEETGRIPGLRDRLRAYGVPTITIGTGLLLCDRSYPVRYQLDLAGQLQKSAKGMFYRSGGKVASAIDFELLTDSSPLSERIETSRKVSYRTEEDGFVRTCRPYEASGFSSLVDRMRKARARMASSQLHALQSGGAEGRRVFLNALRYQIGREPVGKKYQAWLKDLGVSWTDPARVESFFIHELREDEGGGSQAGTWIADGLQIAPFLDQITRLGERAVARKPEER